MHGKHAPSCQDHCQDEARPEKLLLPAQEFPETQQGQAQTIQAVHQYSKEQDRVRQQNPWGPHGLHERIPSCGTLPKLVEECQVKIEIYYQSNPGQTMQHKPQHASRVQAKLEPLAASLHLIPASARGVGSIWRSRLRMDMISCAGSTPAGQTREHSKAP